MNIVTIQAKTVEEAITKATIELGVVSSDLEIEVVEKGSTGFLGIGSKNAVIKASIREEKPVEVSKPVKEIKKEEQKPKEVKVAEKVKPEPKVVKEVEPKKEEAASKEKKINRRTPTPEILEETKMFIVNTLKAMKIEAEVKAKIDEEGSICIDMIGKKMGVLIGKRGQTLDALQYLANRVANKEKDGYIRVKLDTENYRERRKETLENLAKNIASKVKRTKRPVSLEPMNPYERRIIHSALQSDPYIVTYSEGEEPYRHLVVKYGDGGK